jgi:hypothetical protein
MSSEKIELDLRAISDKLTDGFILREYTDRFGIFDVDFKEKAIQKFHTDPVFRARVCGVVSSIMVVIREELGANQ